MKSVMKLSAIVLVIVMMLTLGGTASAAGGKDIVILYTNDVHCAVDANIGYAGLAALKSELAAVNYVTLVDAGDALQGEVLGTLSKGSYLVDIMNKVSYDVIVPGNHEFDYGMDRFLELAELQSSDYICCNFIDLRTGEPVFDSYRMIACGDINVAYIGIDTPETFSKSNPTYFRDRTGKFIYSFCEGNDGQNLYASVQKAIDAAGSAGADYIIAVGHCGTNEQSSPWRSTDIIANVTGLNAFIDGHSHSVIPGLGVKDKDGNTVLLASSGTKFSYVGKLVIEPDGTISSELIADYNNRDADTAAFMGEIKAENEELLKTVVAGTSVDLTINNPDGTRAVRSKETNMGDLVADAYRIVGEADIGWVNGGGVRDGIAAGDITYEHIIAVHPFGNMLCVCKATGQEIIDALEMSARTCPTESGGFLQVSGLKFTIDTTVPSSVRIDDKGAFVGVDGARRVSGVQVLNGKTNTYEPIDLTRTYTLASHDYMLKSGGDGINMFMDNKYLIENGMLDNQVLITYITEKLGGVVPAAYSEPQERILLITSPFTDVVSANWFFPYVKADYEKGVIFGITETTFEPFTALSRAMFVTMLYRMENSPSVNGNVSAVFSDCEDGKWYSDAVLWAYRNRITDGLTSITFGPMEQLTRQQMAAIIYRYALYNGAPVIGEVSLGYSDAASVADWAKPGVGYCSAMGIMNGVTGGIFDPDGTANRAMGAAVVSRIAA